MNKLVFTVGVGVGWGEDQLGSRAKGVSETPLCSSTKGATEQRSSDAGPASSPEVVSSLFHCPS